MADGPAQSVEHSGGVLVVMGVFMDMLMPVIMVVVVMVLVHGETSLKSADIRRKLSICQHYNRRSRKKQPPRGLARQKRDGILKSQ
jgi:hypothetical protein